MSYPHRTPPSMYSARYPGSDDVTYPSGGRGSVASQPSATAYTCRHSGTFTPDGNPCYMHPDCGRTSYSIVSNSILRQGLPQVLSGGSANSSLPSSRPERSMYDPRAGPTIEQLQRQREERDPRDASWADRAPATPAGYHAGYTQYQGGPHSSIANNSSRMPHHPEYSARRQYQPYASASAGAATSNPAGRFSPEDDEARGDSFPGSEWSRSRYSATGDRDYVTVTYPRRLIGGSQDKTFTMRWSGTQYGTREGFIDGLVRDPDQVSETVEAHTAEIFKDVSNSGPKQVAANDVIEEQLEEFYDTRFKNGRYRGAR
ncbi:hypothetical protein IAU59_002503 [Kwoniella sp. CBS 9459]